MKINIVVSDVVSDVTYSSKSVNTRVVITLLLHDVIHWKTATSYDTSCFQEWKVVNPYNVRVRKKNPITSKYVSFCVNQKLELILQYEPVHEKANNLRF